MDDSVGPIIVAGLWIGLLLFVWKRLAPGVSSIPWIAVLLVALGFLRIQFSGETWRFEYAGLPQTALILGIVGLVFLFKASTALEDLLIRLEVLPDRIAPKYGILLPVAIVFAAFQFSWEGASVGGLGMPSWLVRWGDPDYSVHYLLALFIVLKLGRILRVLDAARNELEAEAA